jgi:hypothetical protein
MEDVSIDMKLDKDLLHPKISMKLSDKDDWPMDSTLMGVYNVLWETEKEKLQGRLKCFPPSNCPNIFVLPRSMHPSSFIALPILS